LRFLEKNINKQMKHSTQLTIVFIFLHLITMINTHTTLAASFTTDSTNRKNEETTEMKTLLTPKNKLNSWGVSAGIINQFGQLGHQFGINLALNVNNKWSLGITQLQNISSRNNGKPTTLEKPETMFTALSVEYTAKANSLVHLSFPFLIGSIKKVDLSDPTYRLASNSQGLNATMDHGRGYMNKGHNKSLGIQTGVNFEINVFKYGKIFTGINYRLALGQNSEQHMSGLSGNIGVKLGLFDKKIKHK
jgi:hypothetical protein